MPKLLQHYIQCNRIIHWAQRCPEDYRGGAASALIDEHYRSGLMRLMMACNHNKLARHDPTM